MGKKVNVILFDLNINGTVIKEVLDEQKQKDPANTTVEKFKTVAETIQYFESVENAVILFCVTNGDSLLKLVDLTKKLKPMMKKGYAKFCGFNDINNQKVDLVLKKAGIADILDPTLNKKTFQYKLNFWTKSLRVKDVKKSDDDDQSDEKYDKSSAGANAKKAKASQEKDNEKNSAKGKKARGAINYIPALDLEEDCWLLKSHEDCKLILNKWLIRLLGPGPGVCKWDQVKDKNNPSSQVWKFGARKKEDVNDQLFFFETGAWYFVGQKPEFEWKSNRWIFTSNQPSLIYSKGEEQFSRFVVGENGMEMAENSVFAKTKEESIWQSIEMEKDFNNEDQKQGKPEELKIEDDLKSKENEEETQISVGEDDQRKKKSAFSDDGRADEESVPEDLGGVYSGEGSTEHIEDAPLSGETDGTDHLDTDSESGRFENEEDEISGHLEGEGKTEKINSGPLKGKIGKNNNQKSFADLEGSFEGEEYKEGLLEGDIGTEHQEGGPLKGKIRKGQEKKSFADLEGSFEEEAEEDSGPLSGEISTEHQEGGPLKGKIKKRAEKKSFADLEGSFEEEAEEEDSGPLSGEISTEHQEGGPLKGKIKKRAEKKSFADLEGSFEEGADEEDFGPLSGEISTEHQEGGPLKGKIKKRAEKKSFADLENSVESQDENDLDENGEEQDGDSQFLEPESEANLQSESASDPEFLDEKREEKRSSFQDLEQEGGRAPSESKKKKRMKRVDPITGNFVDISGDEDGDEEQEESEDNENIGMKIKPRKQKKMRRIDADDSVEFNGDDEMISSDGDEETEFEEDKELFDPNHLNDKVKPVMASDDNPFAINEEIVLDEKLNADDTAGQVDNDTKNLKPKKKKKKLKDLQQQVGDNRYKGFSRFNEKDSDGESASPEERASEISEIIDETIDDLNLESGEMIIQVEKLSSDGNFEESVERPTMEDLFENILILKIMKESIDLNEGDQLKVSLTFRYAKQDVSTVVQGILDSIDIHKDEHIIEKFINIKLSHLDKNELKKFLIHYNGRQGNIVKFLKMTKGDAA